MATNDAAEGPPVKKARTSTKSKQGAASPPPLDGGAAHASTEQQTQEQKENGHAHQPQQVKQQQQQQQQQQGSKKKKKTDPAFAFVGAIRAAAKKGSPSEAIAVYEKMKEVGLPVSSSELSTIMQLCAGASGWEAAARAAAVARLPEAQRAAAGAEGGLLTAQIPFPVHTTVPPPESSGNGGNGGGGEGEGDVKRNQKPKMPSIIEIEGWDVRERTPEEVLESVAVLWSDMQQQGVAPDETILTALARAAAVRGDADEALALARRVAAVEATGGGRAAGGGKMVARLRTYQPALVALALAGRAADALAVAEELAEMKKDYLDLTEAEYALLLEAVARGGTYDQFTALLGRMQAELNELRPSTLEVVARFFASPAAAAAFEEGGALAGRGRGWGAPLWVAVDSRGFSSEAGEPLRMFDLEQMEWDTFAEAIAGIARNQEKRDNAFESFMQWLERNGKDSPYEIFLDGANIALFGQNWQGGGFSMPQVKAMWDAVAAANPGRRMLLIFHQRRLREIEQRHPGYLPWIDQLRQSKSIFATPAGSNDDWYWLYACVRAQERGLLVSNDELRDHIWAMLRPKHFLRWKVRHIARYSFPTGGPQIDVPAPYTPCVQQLPGSGAWMVPAADPGGKWMLIAPRP